jgi:DNA-binding NarL/FixJ family response regulator
MKIGVAIADDEELFKIGIAYILSRDPDIQIVFEAINVGP